MSLLPMYLPQVGELAPAFIAAATRGLLNFPDYCKGCWCIFFAHPANFTSAWRMYATFLALKERWFDERNTKLLALSNEPLRQNDWSEKVKRYIGIYLKAPVVEDIDFAISNQYGMASGTRKLPGYDRLAFILDPEGVIRLIIHRDPKLTVEQVIVNLEEELNRLQGKVSSERLWPAGAAVKDDLSPAERSDVADGYMLKPAYFKRNGVNLN